MSGDDDIGLPLFRQPQSFFPGSSCSYQNSPMAFPIYVFAEPSPNDHIDCDDQVIPAGIPQLVGCPVPCVFQS